MKRPSVISEFNQGDIVVVPFPYTDRLTEKRRPALVLSNSKITKQHGLVWLVMITSAENQRWPDDVDISGEPTGLNSPSLIRTAKLATIDAGLVIRVAGKVSAETLRNVLSAIHENLK
jgi:mRNA interferase MazF